MKKLNDKGVPAKKRSGSPSKSSPKTAPGFPSDPSRFRMDLVDQSFYTATDTQTEDMVREAVEAAEQELAKQPDKSYVIVRMGAILVCGLNYTDGKSVLFVSRQGHNQREYVRTALAGRSRAKQSPRSGTERKRATKGSGRKAATPNKQKI